MRTVVVGASSGLGRCIGVGLGSRGMNVALLARRLERLKAAAEEAGDAALAIQCDVTEEKSCRDAIDEAARRLDGIDAIVYTPAIGPITRIEEVGAETWSQIFATNVTGASLVTAAALPHLSAAKGRALYLSSVSASFTQPWPGLGAYGVSKAALERLIEVWRTEHPEVAFTRVVVGDCAGGEGDSATGFANDWNWDLAAEMHPIWAARGLLAGSLLDPEDLVNAIEAILTAGPTSSIPSVVVAPRPPA